MKLACIEHERCGGFAGRTCVWVPDDMTEAELERLARLARDSYLTAEKTAMSRDVVVGPGWLPAYDKAADNVTVGEVRAQHKEQIKVYAEWKAKREAARKPFVDHLVAVSNGMVKRFFDFDQDAALCVGINWGHQHGVTIETSETKISEGDFGNQFTGDRWG